MNEPATTIAGNLAADPELRYTPAGRPVASFTIASTPRYQQDGQWTDGETWFCRCSAWGDTAENIAASLAKGAAVVATGRLRSRSWETDDGTKRTVVELTVDDIGPSLRRATCKVTKTTREHPPPATAPADGQWTPAADTTPAADDPADRPPF